MSAFLGRAYWFPAPDGHCVLEVAALGSEHYAAVVQYPECPHILHTTALPSHSSPDLVQRSLDQFAQRRGLMAIDRICLTCCRYDDDLEKPFCRIDGVVKCAVDRCVRWERK